MKARAAVNKVLGILASINRWIWVSPTTAETFGAAAMFHYRYVLPDITDERRGDADTTPPGATKALMSQRYT